MREANTQNGQASEPGRGEDQPHLGALGAAPSAPPPAHVLLRGLPHLCPLPGQACRPSGASVADCWARRGRGGAHGEGWGLLLTCFFSVRSPRHGGHRGHCRPVHQVVLRRVLHVSCQCRPQDGGSAAGLGVGVRLPLGARHVSFPGPFGRPAAGAGGGRGRIGLRFSLGSQGWEQGSNWPEARHRSATGPGVSAAPRAGTEALGILGVPSVPPSISCPPGPAWDLSGSGLSPSGPAVTGQPRPALGDSGQQNGWTCWKLPGSQLYDLREAAASLCFLNKGGSLWPPG